MDELFFAVALRLKGEVGGEGESRDSQQRDHQHERQQNVTALGVRPMASK